MRKKLIISAAVGLGLVCLMMVGRFEYNTRKQVITAGNTVGIAEDDSCYLVQKSNTIECDSGKVFSQPREQESALTGTPGYLMGENYIGYIVSKPSTPRLMGSGKRIDFFAKE